MHIYIAGPMRGIPEFNFPAFDYAAYRLRGMGHEVFSPADNDRANGFEPFGMTGRENLTDHGFNLRDTLGADLAWIAKHADAVATLDGWEDSKGARAEVALADALELPVFAAGSVFFCVDQLGGESAGDWRDDARISDKLAVAYYTDDWRIAACAAGDKLAEKYYTPTAVDELAGCPLTGPCTCGELTKARCTA